MTQSLEGLLDVVRSERSFAECALSHGSMICESGFGICDGSMEAAEDSKDLS